MSIVRDIYTVKDYVHDVGLCTASMGGTSLANRATLSGAVLNLIKSIRAVFPLDISDTARVDTWQNRLV